MKKKLTGLLAILLAASMALGGCSSNTETQSTEPSSGEEPTEQAESTEEPEDAESAESTEGKHEITDLVIPKTWLPVSFRPSTSCTARRWPVLKTFAT